MTEREYLKFCREQAGEILNEEDMITMLTAWGAINYSLGYENALKEHNIDPKKEE